MSKYTRDIYHFFSLLSFINRIHLSIFIFLFLSFSPSRVTTFGQYLNIRLASRFIVDRTTRSFQTSGSVSRATRANTRITPLRSSLASFSNLSTRMQDRGSMLFYTSISLRYSITAALQQFTNVESRYTAASRTSFDELKNPVFIYLYIYIFIYEQGLYLLFFKRDKYKVCV